MKDKVTKIDFPVPVSEASESSKLPINKRHKKLKPGKRFIKYPNQ